MSDRTEKISDATRQADRRDAQVTANTDRMPTSDEEAKAEGLELDPEVAESYKEQAERGANQKGEGRID